MEDKRKTPISDKVKPKYIHRLVKSEAHRWFELGFQLRVPPSELRKIQASGGKVSPTECFNSVIEWWLQECEGEKYWKTIYSALEDVNKTRRIRELQKEYPPDQKVELDCVALANLLKIAIPDWYMFGSSLDMPSEILDPLKTPSNADVCLLNMISYWYNKSEPTWEDLIEALQQLGNRRLARKIEEEKVLHPPPVTQVPQEKPWQEGIDKTELEYDEHNADVLRSILKVNKWHELGLALKIPSHKLDEIGQSQRYIVHDCRREMVKIWMLRGNDVTWQALCFALADPLVDHLALAKEIANGHRQAGYAPIPMSTPTEASNESGGNKMLPGGDKSIIISSPQDHSISGSSAPPSYNYSQFHNSHTYGDSSVSSPSTEGRPPSYNPAWNVASDSPHSVPGLPSGPRPIQPTETGHGQPMETGPPYGVPVPATDDNVISRTSNIYQTPVEAGEHDHGAI